MQLRSFLNRGGKMAANKAFGRATGMATGAAAGKVKLALALAGVVFAIITLILSFLCLLSGHKPGFLETYALFTLDTSQIGENLIESIDSKLLKLTNLTNLNRDLDDMSLPVTSTVALPAETLFSGPSMTDFSTATMTPISKLAQIGPDRVARGVLSDLTSKVASAATKATAEAASAESKASSKVESAKTAAESKLSSATSAIGSAATSEVAKIAKEIVKDINQDYQELISAANLSDFTSFHLLAACHGTYEFKNGTNITVGDVAQYNATGLHKHVDYCEKQSDLHLVLLAIAILYIIGIICIGASFALGVLGAVKSSFARWAFYAGVAAFVFVFLATLAAHGIAHGAVKIISFIGGPINIKAQTGEKFLAMSWANTILLAIAATIWGTMFFAARAQGSLPWSRLGNRIRFTQDTRIGETEENQKKHNMRRFAGRKPTSSGHLQQGLTPLPQAYVSSDGRRQQHVVRNDYPEMNLYDSGSLDSFAAGGKKKTYVYGSQKS